MSSRVLGATDTAWGLSFTNLTSSVSRIYRRWRKRVILLRHDYPVRTSRTQLLNRRLSIIIAAFLLYALISSLFSLIPIQFASAEWYLRLCSTLISASPLLFAALAFCVVGVFLSSHELGASLMKLSRRVSLLGAAIFFLLLPIQIASFISLIGGARSDSQSVLSAQLLQKQQLQSKLANVRSPSELVELMNSSSIRLLSGTINETSMSEAKAVLLHSMDAAYDKIVTSEREKRNKFYIKAGAEFLKLLATTLVALWAFIGIARLSALPRRRSSDPS